MKFRFSLQKVLDHRRVLEELAQKDFREAQAEARAQLERQEKMLSDLYEAGLQAGRVQSGEEAGGPEKLKQIYEYQKLQELVIKAQKAKVQAAENLVEELREILRQRAVDLKIMERLKERHKEEFLKAQQSREQKENDEMSVLRFKAKDG